MRSILWIGAGTRDRELLEALQVEGHVESVADFEAAGTRVAGGEVDLAIIDGRSESLAAASEILKHCRQANCPTLLLASAQWAAVDSPVAGDGQLFWLAEDDIKTQIRAVGAWIGAWTENRRLRRRIEKRREEAVRRESLLQKLVHDMKSPLTVMLMDLGMLERWWEKRRSDRFLGSVARLTQNCEELAEMIQNLLDAHRLQHQALELKYTTIGLGAVLREALENAPATVEKRGVDLRLDLRDTETAVRVDPVLMGRVLSNLLKAAALLGPAQGEIDLRVRREGMRMTTWVAASGDPLNAETSRALFDSYAHEEWRALGLDAGTGVGLNLSRMIARAHGGDLRVDDSVPTGRCLCLELPVSKVQL